MTNGILIYFTALIVQEFLKDTASELIYQITEYIHV